MYRDLLGAFTGLFGTRRSRLEVSALLLTMAMLPVSELLVTRMFSHLVLHGPERLASDRDALVLAGAGFLTAFAASRAVHHVVRLNRVRVFRRGFEASAERDRGQASHHAWGWAAVFELSTASVALIQVLALTLLFCWLDPVFGALNLVVAGLVLAALSLLYRRQLAQQVGYLAEGRDASTGVDERVGRRLRDAELGAVLASLAMAVALGLVLVRAIGGSLAAADAIVLFLGLRMLYGQVGHLSASAMRFARARARLEYRSAARGTDDGDDDGDHDGEEEDDARGALGLPPAPTAHRSRLVREMLQHGQRGDLAGVRAGAARLAATAQPRPEEDAAREAAEAFAELAAPTPAGQGSTVPVAWWPRPFPGTWGNWAGPLLVRRVSGRPVTYQKPTASTSGRHLVVGGSLLGSARPTSIVVGTGALGPDLDACPDARYVSVRGPLSAAALRRAGGPEVLAHGDPLVLAGRWLPAPRPVPNGRLAMVRHVTQRDLVLRLPDGVDELAVHASRPADVEAFGAALATYDGVVTSDPAVVALCCAYQLPCAAIAPEHRDDLAFVLADLLEGLGLDPAPAHPVGAELHPRTLTAQLEVRRVAPEVLDAVQGHLEAAVAACNGAVAAT